VIRVFRSKKEVKSDIELITAFKKEGDHKALNSLFKRYLSLVYGLCLKYLQNPQDSQDAVMEIFEAIPAKLENTNIDHFKSWLYVVSKNHCLMSIKKRSKQEIFLNSDVEIMDEPHLNEEIDWKLEKIETCLERLDTIQRKCIVLFYLEQNSYKDTSRLTGHDLKTVKSAIQNAKRNIKICVEKLSKSIE